MREDPLFWAKVDKTSSCWIWTGAIDGSGYGILTRSGRNFRAHRYAYSLQVWGAYRGSDSTGSHVLRHSCRNRRCVNPEHLSEGTQRDNTSDTIEHGLSTFGERHAMCKISKESAAEIRRLYATGVWTQQQLGDRFGVTHSMVSMICRFKRRAREAKA